MLVMRLILNSVDLSIANGVNSGAPSLMIPAAPTFDQILQLTKETMK